jgi:hypothetical protein
VLTQEMSITPMCDSSLIFGERYVRFFELNSSERHQIHCCDDDDDDDDDGPGPGPGPGPGDDDDDDC